MDAMVKGLNDELEKDFPAQTLNRPMRVEHPATNRPAPAQASPVAALAPLVRVKDALHRLDALAAALERAEAELSKQLEVIAKRL